MVLARVSGGAAGPASRPVPATPARTSGGRAGRAATPAAPCRPTLHPCCSTTSSSAGGGAATEPAPPPPAGFHVSRMRAAPAGTPRPPPLPALALRVATTDAELAAAAALRAQSFYAYPPERAFAGRLHQELKTREEYEALVAVRDANAAAAAAGTPPDARSVCVIAVAPLDAFPSEGSDAGGGADPTTSTSAPHPALHIGPDPAFPGAPPSAVVGTLDVAFARALPGEDLIGDAAGCAAYMANVCASPAARRRGVGGRLLAAARGAARAWRADALYVHALAVNEVAARFYGGAGFSVEKEEDPSRAKARGHCLDGVEGLGRAVLYRDGRLWDAGMDVETLDGF